MVCGGGSLIIPGNALCLCPWHKAKIEQGKDNGTFNPGNINELMLMMNICGEQKKIKFHNDHTLFINAYWENNNQN